jgi:hypothetical protein
MSDRPPTPTTDHQSSLAVMQALQGAFGFPIGMKTTQPVIPIGARNPLLLFFSRKADSSSVAAATSSE